jgi:hypothetical protein
MLSFSHGLSKVLCCEVRRRLTAVKMTMLLFWVVTQCRSVGTCQRFLETPYFFLTLKMEAVLPERSSLKSFDSSLSVGWAVGPSAAAVQRHSLTLTLNEMTSSSLVVHKVLFCIEM